MFHPNRIVPPAKDSIHYTASYLRKVIKQLGFAVSYVRGVSMRPLIWEDNHYVVIIPVDGKAEIGDLLVFEQIRRNSTAYIVHRLVDIEKANDTSIYITRGDNCRVCERIREEDIIGKVAEIYRNGGWRPWHALPKSHFTIEDKSYRLYSKLWKWSWPLREKVYRFRKILHKVKRKLS